METTLLIENVGGDAALVTHIDDDGGVFTIRFYGNHAVVEAKEFAMHRYGGWELVDYPRPLIHGQAKATAKTRLSVVPKDNPDEP